MSTAAHPLVDGGAQLHFFRLCHMVGLPPSLPGVSGNRVILSELSNRERNSSGNQNF
jgi:hypothetical protein